MTFPQFCCLAGLLLATGAGVVFVLMALARKITRNDARLREDDDFFDYR